MGLLNLVGSVAAGAGEGYGKGQATTGAISLESIIREAQMLKEDNLARLRQKDQNAFTSAENEKARTAQADLTREGWTETGKREADRREAEAGEYATSPQWGLNPKTGKYDQFVSNKRGEVKWLDAGDGGLLEMTKGKKGGGAGKDDAFTDLPSDLEKYFVIEVTDDFGKTTKTLDKGNYADFIRFREVSGERDPRRAFAMWTSAQGTMAENGAPRPDLEFIFGVKENPAGKAVPGAKPMASHSGVTVPPSKPDNSAMVSELNAGRGLEKTVFGAPVFARYSREQIMSVWDQLRPEVQQAYERWWSQESAPPKKSGLLSGGPSRNATR